jgi:hypothetical protein
MNADFADIESGESESYDQMTQDKDPEMTQEISIAPPERGRFHVGRLH